jgi:hypothetical protein
MIKTRLKIRVVFNKKIKKINTNKIINIYKKPVSAKDLERNEGSAEKLTPEIKEEKHREVMKSKER